MPQSTVQLPDKKATVTLPPSLNQTIIYFPGAIRAAQAFAESLP